jgi:hypothetical protein
MEQINIKTPNPTCQLFLKIDLYRDLAAGVYLSEAPWESNFCRFGIWSNAQCITPVHALHTTPSTQPHPLHPLPPRYTLYKYLPLYLITQRREEGRRRTSEKVGVALVYKRV